MQNKSLLLAQTREKKASKFRVTAGIFLTLIAVIGLLLFILRSIEKKYEPTTDLAAVPTKILTESGNDSNTSERRLIEPAGYQDLGPVHKELLPDTDLIEAARNNPLFSAEIARLEERLDANSQLLASEEERAELRNAIELMNEKVKSYAAETMMRIQMAVSEGNRSSFSKNFDSSKQILAVTNSSDFLLFESIDESSYFADYGSMVDAKRKNEIQLELEAAERIISVYQIPGLTQRINELQMSLMKQKTDILESSINKDILAGEFVNAEKLADELRALEPGNRNLESYDALINEGLKKQSIDLLASEISRNREDENFDIALKLVDKLLSIDPTNRFANEEGRWLTDIIALNNEINSLLLDSSRLSDPNVAMYAQNVLNQAQNFEGVDHTRSIAGRLELVLQEYQTPIEVLVKSNNIARIEIRGVGYIEPTESKVVMLQPGKYTLNAVCKGHRNNLIEAIFSNINRSIEVLCGDKL